MSYITTGSGRTNFNTYLNQFKEGSRRVYKSEIQQFFDFQNIGLNEINNASLKAYQEEIGKEHSPSTTKRKFSILNGFFKFLEKRVKSFNNPITTLKEFKTHRGVTSEELNKYIKGFLHSLHAESTKKIYNNQIKLFFSWCGKDLEEIKKSDFKEYRDYLREKGDSPSTIWGKFISLNRFFKFIESENRKFHHPFTFKELALVLPKLDRGYYTVLTKAECERLLKQPDLNTAIGTRNQAILFLMLVYGLRANEVTKLRFKNMDGERVKGQQKLWIVDRKGKYQNRPKTPIILNNRALFSFDAWLTTIKNAGINPKGETPVFLPFIYDRVEKGLVIHRHRQTVSLSVQAIENVVNKYLKKAKLTREEETLSTHALRHTAFTMLAQAGRPIQDIQKLAGHSDVRTTMIYIHSVQSYEDHPGMYSPLNK